MFMIQPPLCWMLEFFFLSIVTVTSKILWWFLLVAILKEYTGDGPMAMPVEYFLDYFN